MVVPFLLTLTHYCSSLICSCCSWTKDSYLGFRRRLMPGPMELQNFFQGQEFLDRHQEVDIHQEEEDIEQREVDIEQVDIDLVDIELVDNTEQEDIELVDIEQEACMKL